MGVLWWTYPMCWIAAKIRSYIGPPPELSPGFDIKYTLIETGLLVITACFTQCFIFTFKHHMSLCLVKLTLLWWKYKATNDGNMSNCLVPSRWMDFWKSSIDVLLCKQTLACTNHREGGEQCGSPWQMSFIVCEYESPCSPIKPILFSIHRSSLEESKSFLLWPC